VFLFHSEETYLSSFISLFLSSVPQVRDATESLKKPARRMVGLSDSTLDCVPSEQTPSHTITISGQDAGVKATSEQDNNINDVDFDGATNLQRAIRGQDDAIMTKEMEEAILDQMLDSITTRRYTVTRSNSSEFFFRVVARRSGDSVGFSSSADSTTPRHRRVTAPAPANK